MDSGWSGAWITFACVDHAGMPRPPALCWAATSSREMEPKPRDTCAGAGATCLASTGSVGSGGFIELCGGQAAREACAVAGESASARARSQWEPALLGQQSRSPAPEAATQGTATTLQL